MTVTQLEHTKVSNDIVIHGTCDQRFQQLHDFFARNLTTGEDIGASAAVFIDGEPVVDVWGGYIDRERTQPWQRDTIVNNFFGEEVAGPLGADYHIGVSPIIQGSPLIQPTGDLLRGLAYHNPLLTPQLSSTIAWRRADHGVMNDLDAHMTVACVMNLHKEHGGLDARGIGVVRAAYEGLFGGNHV